MVSSTQKRKKSGGDPSGALLGLLKGPKNSQNSQGRAILGFFSIFPWNHLIFCQTTLGPLPCFLPFWTMQSRAMGIADHILPLGDWLTPRVPLMGTWGPWDGPLEPLTLDRNCNLLTNIKCRPQIWWFHGKIEKNPRIVQLWLFWLFLGPFSQPRRAPEGSPLNFFSFFNVLLQNIFQTRPTSGFLVDLLKSFGGNNMNYPY